MKRKVKLRMEDLDALLAMTENAKTESGERLRDWVLNEKDRRRKCGELGGRSKRDGGQYPKPVKQFAPTEGDELWTPCEKPDYDRVKGEWIYFDTHPKLGKRITHRESAMEAA